jgi:hypothetical protein
MLQGKLVIFYIISRPLGLISRFFNAILLQGIFYLFLCC